MSHCKECRNYFSNEENADQAGRGDCVRRVVDPKQVYYTSVPVDAEQSASNCPMFIKK